VFDITRFKNAKKDNCRYERRLDLVRDQKGIDTSCIERTVNEAVANLNNKIKSFVIYGEPQSGKTEMMIALTAKLLDEGNKIVIVLLNDNVELLKQNLKRFRRSGIDPDPKNFTEIIDQHVIIADHKWIIFCKKNAKDLKKLIDKVSFAKEKIIIDDEADYASPNAKINKGEVTKINELISKLLGRDGTYIGITATPARLDLNNTFANANEKWVNFAAHSEYTGQKFFFPIKLKAGLQYQLTLLPEHGDDPKYLRTALFNFFIRVSHLNVMIHKEEKNYCMLIHTSGKRADHTEDYKQVIKIINVLKDEDGHYYEKYIEAIWKQAKKIFGEAEADKIVEYIIRNISRNAVVVMNSSADKKNVDYDTATSPNVPFTMAIGGNIVSRGVTFHNLISMFFTRDVKHKMQQDTYIQRARMFGARKEYAKFFDLSIPEHLFLDWHKCFVLHRLALESIKSGNGCPVWLESDRVSAVASGSINKATVVMDSGEMGYDVFNYDDKVESIITEAINGTIKNIDALKKLNLLLTNQKMPKYVINYVDNFSPSGDKSIAFHKSFCISGYKDADQDKIQRPKGFIGTGELEKNKYPNALHHFKIFYNNKSEARIYYRFVGNVKFLKNLGIKKYE